MSFLPINVEVYRLHVVITWGTTAEAIERYASRHGCEVSKRFKEDFKENTESGVLGLCMVFSNDSPDVLVWLAERPKKASSYGTLYHELYHAVDSISESRNLSDELEARAYIFEYLITRANKFFGIQRR